MTIQRFVEDCFLAAYREDYIANARHYVLEMDAVPLLLETMSKAIEIQANPKNKTADPYLATLSKSDLEKVVFRSAYVFEAFYQYEPGVIKHENFDFLALLLQLKSKSAQRLFLKILASVLENDDLKVSKEDAEKLVETIAQWTIDPNVKVAVQINAFECLVLLKDKASEATFIIEELVEIFRQVDSAAMRCRLRRWHLRELI